MPKYWLTSIALTAVLLTALAGCAANPGNSSSAGDAFAGDGANPGLCVASLATPEESPLVQSVTLSNAPGEQPSAATFAPEDIIHVRVAYQDAPAGTRVRVTWLALKTEDPATCDVQVGSQDQTADGTGALEFSLPPQNAWPKGGYKAQLYIDGILEREINYTVQ